LPGKADGTDATLRCYDADALRRAAQVLLLGLAVAGRADAHPAPADTEPRDWHAGVNLRTDFGTHALRVDGGVRWNRWDAILVLDPMIWIDGQHDLDLLGEWRFAEGWAAVLGWRATSVGLADGRQWQEKSVLGVAGGLPALFGRRVRGQAGFECTVLWVKHGAGLPTETISASRAIADQINFGMFARFEYASGF
jgi:hypothetical protein